MRRSFNVPASITRPFGVYDPESYGNYPGKKHPGTDYGLEAGTPLVAGMSGTVTAIVRGKSNVGRGNEVVITSGNKQRKTCHMNAIYVKTGQHVNEGDPIGLSGNTGYVLPAPTPKNPNAGAHLHDELLLDGQYVDLEKYLKEGGSMAADNLTKEEIKVLYRVGTLGQEAPEDHLKFWTGKGVGEYARYMEQDKSVQSLQKEYKRRYEAFDFHEEEIAKRDTGIELLRGEIEKLRAINPKAAEKLEQIKEIVEKE